jgi:hypothetical protein
LAVTTFDSARIVAGPRPLPGSTAPRPWSEQLWSFHGGPEPAPYRLPEERDDPQDFEPDFSGQLDELVEGPASEHAFGDDTDDTSFIDSWLAKRGRGRTLRATD